MRPPGILWHPEHILSPVFIPVLRVSELIGLELLYRSSNASEMYFRKTRPRTTCLYSPGSMWPRILSAAFQSFSSKPRFASLFVLPFFCAKAFCLLTRDSIKARRPVVQRFPASMVPINRTREKSARAISRAAHERVRSPLVLFGSGSDPRPYHLLSLLDFFPATSSHQEMNASRSNMTFPEGLSWRQR